MPGLPAGDGGETRDSVSLSVHGGSDSGPASSDGADRKDRYVLQGDPLPGTLEVWVCSTVDGR